tara:strand:- start:476 stop:1612 length:1137 start_codon:yes stop_codon:yes gene_type:complete
MVLYVVCVAIVLAPALAFSGLGTTVAKKLVSHDSSSLRRSLNMVSERTRLEFQKSNAMSSQTGGAGGSSSLQGLERLDDSWEKLRNGGWKNAPPTIVKEFDREVEVTSCSTFDIAVCGGTLGIFYALAFQKQGKKVCIVERGKVAGRPQEWNISGKEMNVFIDLGIFSREEIDSCIAIEFNPVRVGFKTDTSAKANIIPKGEEGYQFELYTKDVLNLGILPSKIIALAKTKFEEMGGVIYENQGLNKIDVYKNMACLTLQEAKADPPPTPEEAALLPTQMVQSRCVIDCMGNASPISKQIRGPVEPDGVCIVVGGCARGFKPENNTYSDLIYTDTPITREKGDGKKSALQYFWEAFPTGSGPGDRTTYLFTYVNMGYI